MEATVAMVEAMAEAMADAVYGGYGYQQPQYGGYRPYGYGEGVVVQPRVYSDYDEPVVRRRVYRERYVWASGGVALSPSNGLTGR